MNSMLTTEQSVEVISDLAKKNHIPLEALVVENKNFKASFQNQKINNYNVSHIKTLGIRVFDGANEGIAYTESFNFNDVESCFKEAMENKNFVSRETAYNFCSSLEMKDNTDFFNANIEETAVEEKLDHAKKLEFFAFEFSNKVHSVPYSAYEDRSSQITLYTTAGTHASYRANSCYSYIAPLCIDGEQRGMSIAAQVSQKFENLQAKEIAENGVRESLLKLQNEKPKTGIYTVVLNSKASQTFLNLLVSHLSLKSVDERSSALSGRVGQSIFSDKLTIVDDPLKKGGLSSRPFDAEGILGKPTTVIKNGVLQTYLTNSIYAQKYKVKNTGHASRGPKSALGIESTNLVVQTGTQKFEDLVAADAEVLVIDQLRGLAGVNPISGDFSIESEGFLYRNGMFSNAVSNFTLSGNVFECLKNIEAVADDVFPTLNSIYTPSLLVGKLSVAGK